MPKLLHALVLSLTSSLPVRELLRRAGVGVAGGAGTGVLGECMHVAMRGFGTCCMRGMQCCGRSRGVYACGHAGSWNAWHAGHAAWKRRVYQRLELVN